MDKEISNTMWVNVREIGVILNVHAFVVYSYLLQTGIRCVKDRYGNGYVNVEVITKHFDDLREYIKSLRNGRKSQFPFKKLAFINPQAGIHSDWESKADGLDKVKKEFLASYDSQLYRINHYSNSRKALFKWDRYIRTWRYVEETKSAIDTDKWLDSISHKYKLCNTYYDSLCSNQVDAI